MKSMKGWRTVVTNLVALIVTLAALRGVDIPADSADAVVGGVVGVLSIVNIILRAVTSTPIGRKG